MNILLVGGGGREHAIAHALCREKSVRLYSVMQNRNPGIIALSVDWVEHDENDIDWVAKWALERKIDLGVVGFEEPLGLGLCDKLEEIGVPALGPKKAAAQLETSKLFTRQLMSKYNIPGQAKHYHFTDADTLEKFLKSTNQEFALKPIGLTAGKGVKVMGEHFASVKDAIEYGRDVIEKSIGGSSAILLEEKLIGEEFTLQCFVDGKTVSPMPLVQDYKRAFEGDKGPNTGGMGSYSFANGLLPFVTEGNFNIALGILKKIIESLAKEGIEYKGVLYGQFILTDQGLKLIEINARFGDPEAMNVLSLLETNFLEICKAIVEGSLDRLNIKFSNKATVCVYVTPKGYGDNPKAEMPLRVDETEIEKLKAHLYYAKVNIVEDIVLTTTSRALAVVGIADSIEQAYLMAEEALACVHGDYHVRHDIAKKHIKSQSTSKPRGAGSTRSIGSGNSIGVSERRVQSIR